jgi:hypothetical protein
MGAVVIWNRDALSGMLAFLLLLVLVIIRLLGDEVCDSFLSVAEDEFAAVVTRDVFAVCEEPLRGQAWRPLRDLLLLGAAVVLYDGVFDLPVVVLVDGTQDLSGAPDEVRVADVEGKTGFDVCEAVWGEAYVRLRL